MKKEWITLIFIFLLLLINGGIGVFIQGVIVVVQGVGLGISIFFQTLIHLPTSLYDLVSSGVTTNWHLTYVVWIDTLLVNIAVFAPSVAIFLIGLLGIKKIHPLVSFLISISVLFAVLELFSSVAFWIVLGTLILLGIGASIYLWITSIKEQQTIVNEATEHPIEEIKLDEIKEQIIIETQKFYSVFELWKRNGYRPFKAYNSVNKTYVYISTNPSSQRKKYNKVYGRLSYDKDTYNHGTNCEIYYASKQIWELA